MRAGIAYLMRSVVATLALLFTLSCGTPAGEVSREDPYQNALEKVFRQEMNEPFDPNQEAKPRPKPKDKKKAPQEKPAPEANTSASESTGKAIW